MRRPPILPTLLVGLAVAVMIGLGIWQLQRKAEKEVAITSLTRAAGQPLLEIGDARLPPDFAYRRARIRLLCPAQRYEARAGQDVQGRSGWMFQAACRTGSGEAVRVVLGWSTQSDIEPAQPPNQLAEGTLAPDQQRVARVYLANPPDGLAPAAPPSIDDIPNNHLSYAFQWFFFAAAAAVIYILALRRRSR